MQLLNLLVLQKPMFLICTPPPCLQLMRALLVEQKEMATQVRGAQEESSRSTVTPLL